MKTLIELKNNSLSEDIQKTMNAIDKKEPFLNRIDEERALRKAHAQAKIKSMSELNSSCNKLKIKIF